MCGRPSTTIGFERLFNPLARMDRAPFISLLTSGVPPRPLNMVAIEATNRGAADLPWAMLVTAPRLPEISADELAERSPEAVVLDVREPAEYAHGHVPGAINLPQAELALRLEEIPKDRPIMTICHAGLRSYRSGQFLRQSGFAEVASVKGGIEAWRAAGQPVTTGDAAGEAPRIAESEWAHAGALAYGQALTVEG